MCYEVQHQLSCVSQLYCLYCWASLAFSVGFMRCGFCGLLLLNSNCCLSCEQTVACFIELSVAAGFFWKNVQPETSRVIAISAKVVVA